MNSSSSDVAAAVLLRGDIGGESSSQGPSQPQQQQHSDDNDGDGRGLAELDLLEAALLQTTASAIGGGGGGKPANNGGGGTKRLGMTRTKSLFSMSSTTSSDATTSSPSSVPSSLEEEEEEGEERGDLAAVTTQASATTAVGVVQCDHLFGQDVRLYTEGQMRGDGDSRATLSDGDEEEDGGNGSGDNRNNDPHLFDSGLRRVMEPHLRHARRRRERCRIERHNSGGLNGDGRHHHRRHLSGGIDPSIADSVGVPYTQLRQERPFLYDEQTTYPLHRVLADALGVPEDRDLSQLHLIDQERQGAGGDSCGAGVATTTGEHLLKPLLDPDRRRAFHEAYDGFVTSFCIPLLHSLAIAKKALVHASPSDQIVYRYQSFPSIRVQTPGSTAIGPTCDTSDGHSIGCLRFHVPLTPSYGTNALYAESHPGREDWHPLSAKSVGLGYLFDGARCLHYEMENTTPDTRVSLDFRFLVYRDTSSSGGRGHGRTAMVHDGGLCPEGAVEDMYSRSDPNYYDEAVVDLGRNPSPFPGSSGAAGAEVVFKRYGDRLQPPSKLSGPPFSE